MTVRHLKVPGLNDIFLACIHFPSKLYCDDASQAMECTAIAEIIRSVERRFGHERTVLVGDLNMNPFEDGVVSASGFHGVMARRVAEAGTRIVQGRKYPFFYNPMWACFGDRPSGPPGTYYYGGSTQKVLFWNMFDQVMIRPDLLPCFDNDSLQVLQSDGINSLLSSDGRPNINMASDHLPLVFGLNL